jgi:asparagine synthase (glutamine-hydrolysing)
MCGIAGIILKERNSLNLVQKIVSMSETLSHRGPDGEGFIMANETYVTPHFNQGGPGSLNYLNYAPASHISESRPNCFLAFAHRRLAIIDLSETGHQPMCTEHTDLWITFNGEIYNYLELREELKQLGRRFVSESDTEVILQAYQQWGFECVNRFNGMWGFCIYDRTKKICFASRDRLGVKPFYYVNNAAVFAFASEQKALVKAGLASSTIHEKALHSYLVNGLLENEAQNFFADITELWPGCNLIYNLSTRETRIHPYYHLENHIHHTNDDLSEKELIEKIAHTFENSVKLRLRSDVEVGTCLSGGIDSSALAITIAEITEQPFYCFTSVFKGQAFNEEHFADAVARKIHARHVKTEPQLEGFIKEADALIYSQDVPIWDTSTYAQYKVMELAKQNHIKVVLDGQGADELFGGYHHHFAAKWNNLLSRGKIFSAMNEISESKKTIANPFSFYIKERFKHQNNYGLRYITPFLKKEFVRSYPARNPYIYVSDVNRQLISDIYDTRLKSFLKCEDRCGMWHGVESRTPFSDDIELISLLFSFNGNKKIKKGISKYLLREALKTKLPPEIYTRYDKKGFETPMQQWMQQMRPQLLAAIKAADFSFVDYRNLEKMKPGNALHNKLLFKLFVLSRWTELFK